MPAVAANGMPILERGAARTCGAASGDRRGMPRAPPRSMESLYGAVETRLRDTVDLPAEDLVHVVLGTLGAHLPPKQSEALAGALPEELQDIVLYTASEEEAWDEAAFLEDLAERLEMDPADSGEIALAVLREIGRALAEEGAETEYYAALPDSLRTRVERLAAE